MVDTVGSAGAVSAEVTVSRVSWGSAGMVFEVLVFGELLFEVRRSKVRASASSAGTVLAGIIEGEVFLKSGQDTQEAERGEESKPAAQDHQPGADAALRVLLDAVAGR